MWKTALFIMVIFLAGCNQQPANDSEENNSNTNSADSLSLKNENEPTTTSKVPDYEKITINGDYVRVRDKPQIKGSEVKFQLMTGDQCNTLEQGTEETLNGVTGHWYKIDCSGKVGWVWGGLTSKASDPSNKELEEKWSEDENAFVMDMALCAKMQKSLTDFYEQCSKDPECKIEEKPLENAFDGDQTVIIASAIFKESSIGYVEDGSWPFQSDIVNEEIGLGPGIKVGMTTAELEKIVGKTVKAKIYRIQGENDQFYLRITNGKITKIEYEGYTG